MHNAQADNLGRVLSNGLVVRSGYFEQTDARSGKVTLVAGAATITTTAIKATSDILLSYQTVTGTPGILTLGSRTAGASFTVQSLTTAGAPQTLDLSTVFWMIVDSV